MKEQNKINLNAYLFANLVILCALLVGLWNMKPLWEVSIGFENLLLILVILNTILIFKEVILTAAQKSRKTKNKKSLAALRTLIKKSKQLDNKLLESVLKKLSEIGDCKSVILYNLSKDKSNIVVKHGAVPATLSGSRFVLNNNSLSIRYPGNLGEEKVGKINRSGRPLYFKSVVTRLEIVILPLFFPLTKECGLCVFTDKSSRSLNVSLASTALVLETLVSVVHLASNNKTGEYKDKLTGLLKNEFFEEAFETEIERAERYEQETSLLSLKLEGYSKLSDEEKVIIRQAVSSSLKQSLRRLDLMFCGKNEDLFMAVLTETGVNASFIVAERIQKYFTKNIESKLHKKLDVVKMHIGFATYPTDGMLGQGIVEKSFDALQHAIKDNLSCKAYGKDNNNEEKQDNES